MFKSQEDYEIAIFHVQFQISETHLIFIRQCHDSLILIFNSVVASFEMGPLVVFPNIDYQRMCYHFIKLISISETNALNISFQIKTCYYCYHFVSWMRLKIYSQFVLLKSISERM